MFQHLFHLARQHGGFTYYGATRRLPAIYYFDLGFAILLIASTTVACVLLVLLPAIRRKLATLFTTVTLLSAGAVAGYCLIIPEWQVGYLELPAERISYWQATPINETLRLKLYIGLTKVNVTLYNRNRSLYYDEAIRLDDTLSNVKRQYRAAQYKGLPASLLSMLEQVAMCGDAGSCWVFHVRRAGYLCSWVLYLVLAAWAYSLLLHLSLPGLSAQFYTCSGFFINSCGLLYWWLLHSTIQPNIYISGVKLMLHYGPCFYLCLIYGFVVSLVGLMLIAIDQADPSVCVTALNASDNADRKASVHTDKYQDSNVEFISEVWPHVLGVSHIQESKS